MMLGEYALSGAMLTAMAVLFAAFAFWRTGNDRLVRAMRWGVGLLAGLLSVSSWGLLKALMDDNFSLAYVVKHSEKTLALGYKIAAFWAGQEGSLLFWAWVLSVMGVLMAIRFRRKDDSEAAVTLATMTAVTGFFTCVMLFAGNPFELMPTRELDGQGLNPALQNFAMVAHPPLLFLGYAGFTAPFALMLGALISGRKDGRWLPEARKWMIYAWTMLTVGILLGAQWAYVELGWGGYWAWDPVENASLLPWLTGTALLHSAVLADKRGMFKRWNVALIALSFLLCVFGTYITRSGVIQSVHAFEESSIGTFFLVFMIAIALVSVFTILSRLSLLRTEHPLVAMLSREGAFLAANVLLVAMMLVTLVGTVFPLISKGFSDSPVTVAGPFYNKVVLPMGMLLVALMSLGPVLGHGQDAVLRARGKLIAMLVTGVIAAAAAMLLGYTSIWAIFAAAIVTAVATAVVIDTVSSVRVMVRIGQVSALTAIFKVFASHPRHWGAQLGHLGLAAIVAGIVGSSVYGVSEKFSLNRGQSAQLGKYTLTYNGIHQTRRANHTAIIADVNVIAANGQHFQLQPEQRFYDRGADPNQSATEVAIRPSLGTDVYMTLVGWDDKGETAAVQLFLNPLVNWIWIGGALITLGGLICLIPTRHAPVKTVPQIAAEPPAPIGHTARERRRAQRQAPEMVRQ